MESFTKTFTGATVELIFENQEAYDADNPKALRLIFSGWGPNVSAECALRNAHKGPIETSLYFPL
jgi:hypothetical protein